MRVVDVLVNDLDKNLECEIQELIRVSFDRQKDVNLSHFKSVVVIQEKVERRLFLGLSSSKWKAVGVMLVKTDEVMREEFPEAGMCVNLTCVCVSNILRGRGIGTSMMKWFLNTLPVGTVVYLHVDKIAVNVEVEKREVGNEESILHELDHSETGEEMHRVEYLGKAEISSQLVKWYKTMGFQVRYENDMEVCLFQYIHVGEIPGNISSDSEESTYDDDFWDLGKNNDMYYHEDMTD
tara:strand:+ start:12133 stop:12843 length:711 start_codon:yes stop_codon:yes gene_type:complete